MLTLWRRTWARRFRGRLTNRLRSAPGTAVRRWRRCADCSRDRPSRWHGISPRRTFLASSGNYTEDLEWVTRVLERLPIGVEDRAQATQADAASTATAGAVISTDPPYYDNIGYADLSDFFYVWLRRSLRGVHPNLLSTMLVPKAEELVANPYRHDGKDGARSSSRMASGAFSRVPARPRSRVSQLPSTTLSSSQTPAKTGPPRRAGRPCSTG